MNSTKTTERKTKKNEWHALSSSEVIKLLQTRESGLTTKEIEERTDTYGTNIFTEKNSVTWVERFLSQFKNPLTIVLVLAFFVTVVLHQYIDASVIFFALMIAVFLGVFQEGKASKAFEKLASSQEKTAHVIREGKRHMIPSAELVPGDIIEIRGGMQVPADIRIIESKKLAINEASLTGEWLSVDKSNKEVTVGTPLAETRSMAYLGTFVASGRGLGVVVSTGDTTVLGSIAQDLEAIVEVETPIQVDMRKISQLMLWVVVVLVFFIFLIGLIRGEEIELMLLTAIAIAVAAIPEGLPAAVTIILAVGMESLLKRGGLVRNLLAAETLGSTTYILTDKTGTLTEARMAITQIVYEGCSKENNKQVHDWSSDEKVKKLLNIALCASDAFLDEHTGEDESYVVRGEPMERAILEAAQETGITVSGVTLRAQRSDYLAFESENRFAAGLTQEKSHYQLCINGAPELLLEKATRIMKGDGDIEITTSTRSFFEEEIKKHTGAGRRLIAVGYKTVSYEDIPEEEEDLLNGLTFGGILIITDPVRKDVKESIRGVLSSGVHIRLVTGDNPGTALTVAREVGIAGDNDTALTGDDIAKLSDKELLEVIHTTRVFARVLPRQKMRLVQILQLSGEIVAMTGDGINDAPALRKANIGVAIGSGTEVAKESSDLVLVNDSFSTVYAAIEEGRRIVGNLRKIVGYLVATSFTEAALIGVALLTGGALPILPAQILWANIIEEGLMSIAFAFEPGDKNAMRKKPQDIHAEGILSHDMLMFSGLVAGVLGFLLLSLYAFLRITDVPLTELRSVMFLAISLDSLFIAFSFRSLSVPVWKVPLRTNIFFVVSFIISFLMLIIVISVPFLQFVFSYEPLPLFDFTLVFLYGFFSMLVIEVGKWLFFVRKK